MGKLVMGYWDCPYCGQSGIEGTLRECPSCGHPREKDTKFYMKANEKRYLTEEEGKNKGKGADWICGACDTLNSALDDHCKSCGSPRDIEDGDYFSQKKVKTASSNHNKLHTESRKVEKDFTNIFIFAAIAIMIGITAFMLYSFLSPTTENFHVDNVYWKTTQEVEILKTYHEEGWNIPEGGRQTDKKWVVKTYEPVLDHYEPVQKSRQVQVIDHYVPKSNYSDNGDGTFTENIYREPVYRTDTEYYTEQEPVYRDEPVYAWKYWYDIDRWKVSDKLTKTGEKDVVPVTYAAVSMINETTRAGNKYIEYFCDVTYTDEKKKGETETYELSEELYKKIKNNINVTCKIRWGEIIEIFD